MNFKQTRRMIMLVYPDANSVDITGPLQVFSTANRLLKLSHGVDQTFYITELIGPKPFPIQVSAGINLIPDYDIKKAPQKIDTLFIAGGIGAQEASKQKDLQSFINKHAKKVKRLASICTGAFVLAETGLLNDRRATTHWDYVDKLRKYYPKLRIDGDAIFTKDEYIYCSAGVTAGIDLALSMLEQDWGQDIALATARQMVVFLKRPGGQSQFSSLLSTTKSRSPSPVNEIQRWCLQHLEEDLSVETLAKKINVSPRHFSRLFKKETGTTPGKFILLARLDKAKNLLETSTYSLQVIAKQSGLGTTETLRRLFINRFSTSPRLYRERFLTKRKIN